MRPPIALLALAGMLAPVDSATAQETVPPIVSLVADGTLLHCVKPNARRKTCQTIDTFEPMNEGVYYNTMVVASTNGVTVELGTPVWLGEDAYCGTIREQDYMAATVRLNGREVHAALAQAALAEVVRQGSAMMDREFCVRYEGSGANFVAKVTLDGVRRPEFDTPVRIVRQADGYRVAL